jgi:hypothetical protein
MHADYSKFCTCRECSRYDWQEVRDALLGALVLAIGIYCIIVMGGVL